MFIGMALEVNTSYYNLYIRLLQNCSALLFWTLYNAGLLPLTLLKMTKLHVMAYARKRETVYYIRHIGMHTRTSHMTNLSYQTELNTERSGRKNIVLYGAMHIVQGGPNEFYSGNWSILFAVWRSLSIFSMSSLKQHILEHFNFRSKLQLYHPVIKGTT